MNQLGPIFKQARTESGKSIEDAVRETKIARKYLVAIEEENFDAFPGETYLIGFLRNYAQFLGLDPNDIIHRYRDYKIQEQPAPIEQLTAKPRGLRRNLYVVIVFLIVVTVSLYFIFTTRGGGKVARERKKAEETVEKTAEAEKQREAFLFEEEEVIRSFGKAEVIDIPWTGRTYRITIDGIDDSLEFSIEDIPFSLSTDERVEIDFNRDGRKDLLIRANRLGDTDVNLTLKKLFRSDLDGLVTADSGSESGEEGAGSTLAGAVTPEVVIVREDEILASIPVAPESGFQILTSYEMTDIRAFVEAVSPAYFAYVIDGAEKEEQMLQRGENLSVSASEVIRIMVANARGIQMKVNDVDVTVGAPGEVVVKVIRWYRDPEDGDMYYLMMDDLTTTYES